jgi:ribonuclease E
MRDLGGVIVMDFIDMRDEKNRRAVERELKEVMKGDRAKNRILRINSFGILQMTRQRLGPPLKHSYYRNCPQCDGLGMIKSEESQALVVMRLLARASANEDVAQINITCPPPVAHYLTNSQRRDIILIEEKTAKTIVITADREMTGDDVRIECINARGSKIAGEAGKHKRGKIKTARLEAFLDEQAKKSASAKPAETPQQGDDDSAKPASPKKTRRRRRSGAAKKAAETKSGADAKAGEPPKKAADKPAKSAKTKKKKSDKPAKPDKKKTDTPKKASKSGKRRSRKSSKPAAEKTDKGAPPEEAAAKKSAKKTSKRAKKSKSARRKPSPAEPASDQPAGADETPAVTPPSQLREEFEARQREEQKGKPPQKTLLEAMGFDDKTGE